MFKYLIFLTEHVIDLVQYCSWYHSDYIED